MSTLYLDDILADHRARAARDNRALDDLIDEAKQMPPTRGFVRALRDAPALGVIAEVKRRSPSKGDLNLGLDPAQLSAAYAAGGAACCSVLTDEKYFGGSPADLAAVRAAVEIPVLRKDFTVSAHDVVDARLMGADCVLLIIAALSDLELAEFHSLATDLGLDVLVEVHDEAEAQRAMMLDGTLIGVNQRDLRTFEVDTERAKRVAASLPENVVRVAESGIGGPDDIGELIEAGFHAVLVGESLVKHQGPADGVKALIAAAERGGNRLPLSGPEESGGQTERGGK